jgi:hypothetical protein
LSHRHQFTGIDDAKSNPANFTCGVPQGSILDPLVSDIDNATSDHSVKLFAHDTNLQVKICIR